MFSALKRLTSKNDSNNASGPPGHYAMSQNLQKKFAKGIQYNMKIVIKGDRNVGKTCLFHRLQGKKFVEEYICTEEIQVASIQWNYKATDDVVKVEVWDIVDKGKKRVQLEGLKLGDNNGNTPALDAEFLDVYKGTNGVIMVMDITKNWSFEYVQREVIKVPSHIPVLVLGNHCDMAHHRTVTADMVTAFIDSVQRPQGSAQIRYAEASMRNGFGLKLLHKFFCLPFLHLQRLTLLGQIERNRQETEATLEELDLFQSSDHADYDKFIDSLTNKRRQEAELNARLATSQSSVQVVAGGGREGGGGGSEATVQRSQSVPEVRMAAPPAQPFPNTPVTARILARTEDKPAVSSSKIHSVEEFMPDGGELDKSFLEDSPVNSKLHAREEHPDSDSEVETSNPLVAGFQDELDPDDVTPPQLALPPSPISDTPAITPEPPRPQEGDGGLSGLDDWLGGMAGGRVSPEGGEDSSPGADAMLRPSTDKADKKKSKHKKKSSSKDKEKDTSKEEKKSKKKKSSRRSSVSNGTQGHDELEEFLNSHDSAYEAF